MEFTCHLSLTLLDQPQSDILVFAIINFQIYNVFLTKWKHVIGTNDIITFNKELGIISTSIIELSNIYESSNEEAIVIFIAKI